MPGHYDKYPDGSASSVNAEIHRSLTGHDTATGPKPKKPAKPVKEIKASQSKVKKASKKKKSKSFMQKLFNKLKIKRGGGGMGGEMPLTNLDLKKLGSRRSKLR